MRIWNATRKKPNRELPIILIIIGTAETGEADGGAHVFHKPQIFEDGSFGDIELICQIDGAAGALAVDEVIQTDEPIDKGVHGGMF